MGKNRHKRDYDEDENYREQDGENYGDGNEDEQYNEGDAANATEEEKSERQLKREKKIKKMIKDWWVTDRAIKEFNTKQKKLRDQKKELETNILELMEKAELTEHKFTMKNGDTMQNIYRAKSVSKVGIKEDLIKMSIMQIIPNERKANEILDTIDGHREIKERYYLKSTKN